MNQYTNQIQHAFSTLHENSRIWVYQSNQFLSEEQVSLVELKLKSFVSGWNNHGTALKGEGLVLFNLFIVLAVDESEIGASGCSIDSSMRIIKELESELGVSFTDRMKLAYLEDKIILTSLQELPSTVHEGTWVFNNLVTNLGEWKSSWLAPLQKTWVKRFLKTNSPIFSSIK
jgi:hypothetical protein